MKKIFIYIVIGFLFVIYSSNAEEISFKYIPGDVYAGSVILIMEDGSSFLGRNLIDLQWDGTSRQDLLVKKTRDFITMRIPDLAEIGNHTIYIELDDNVFGSIDLLVREKQSVPGDTVNGYDPDPNTQNGLPVDRGSNPTGIYRKTPVSNPSGGHGGYAGIPCDSLHSIDGMFTDSVFNAIHEWESIVPLQGQFANLYLDYCGTEKTLYVMNDWVLGNGEYDSLSCYNLFEFMTGNGNEKWQVKVWNAVSKGVEVYRNGVDVSNDSNYVIGGMYGFNESPLEEEEHTMWEFGLRVQSGLYIMRLYRDEVGMLVIEPNVRIICDEGGVEGYGLVQAPEIVTGYFSSSGSLVNNHDRYIPISGVAGLVTEPSEFAGILRADTATVRVDGGDEIVNLCNDNHTIDGVFTDSEGEWSNSQPAIGTYSNLYAEYCDGILYILNDWTLGTEEPDQKNCYNLFELFTGDGAEHWGIFVYHDVNRGIKVFRNGVDVSDSTDIVLGGAFGFDNSPLMEEEHTIYEFAIKAEEGGWHLFLCDPSPASFCDLINEDAPRPFNSRVGIRKITDENFGTPGDHYMILMTAQQDTLELAYGSQINFFDWFVRQFKVEIRYDENNFLPVAVETPKSNSIADMYESLTLRIEAPGIAIIEGISNENFKSSGDLFILKCIPLFETDDNVELRSELQYGNRTTFMYQDVVPVIQLEKSNFTSVDNIIESLSVYPNPVVKNMKIELSLNKEVQVAIELYDVSGNKTVVYSDGYLPSGINIIEYTLNPDLPSGSYFLRVNIDGTTRLFKVRIFK
jgi:hypothetical protein